MPQAVIARARIALYGRVVAPTPLIPVTARASVRLVGAALAKLPTAVLAAASIRLFGRANGVVLDVVVDPPIDGGKRLKALLTSLHLRTADLAQALDRPELATGAKEETRLVAFIEEAGAEVARRAPQAVRSVYELGWTAGWSHAPMPVDAAVVLEATFTPLGGDTAYELRRAYGDEAASMTARALTETVPSGVPTCYHVVRGMDLTDGITSNGKAAFLTLDASHPDGGALALVTQLYTCTRVDATGPHGREVTPGLSVIARRALVEFTLYRWLEARAPELAAARLAEFERAMGLALTDPARPNVTRARYRAL